jgi:hypothetical protein
MATRTHNRGASRAASILRRGLASLVLALAGCSAGSVGTAVPPSPTGATTTNPPPADGSSTPGQSIGSTPALTIPATALLTSADQQFPFTGVSQPSEGVSIPNPFNSCGPDGLPGNLQPLATIYLGFTYGGEIPQPILGSESVIRFGANGAHTTFAAAQQLVSGACAGKYQTLSTSLGGAESVLLRSTDGDTVGAQAAHGVALYFAIIRAGDYLLWVTLIDQSREGPLTDLATTLARRGLQRMCAAVPC